MKTTGMQEKLDDSVDQHPDALQILTDSENGSLFFRLFRIDLRSLALLRIALGIILMATAFTHLNHVDLFFSEEGVLPQSLNKQYLGQGYWSLFWINEGDEYANSLIVLLAVFAGVFTLGFQTRFCNVVCLILLWSIQVRNPLILTGGGVLLRMLLFWSLFLPMNAIWSIDSHRTGKSPRRWLIASVGTMAMMLQIVYMYFFSGLAKLNPFWLNGDATEYALRLEMSVKPLGVWLADQTSLLFFVTFFVVIAEVSTIFVMFIPRLNHFTRGALMGFFWLMHVAIWMTMSIGLFSATAMMAWLVFVPSEIWNLLLGQPVGFSVRSNNSNRHQTLQRVSQLVCGVFLFYVTVQNIVFALGPTMRSQFRTLEQFGSSTMTIQKFQMFSEPPLFSPWFEYTAVLEDGKRADLFNDRHKDVGDKPESVFAYMKSQSWRRLHWNLISHPLYPPEDELVYLAIRTQLLDLMIRRWNIEHFDNPVVEARLICHLEPIELKRINPEDRNVFANHNRQDLNWANFEKEISRRR